MSPTPTPETKPKPSVFVSYSHEDKKYLDELLPFLEALELNEHIGFVLEAMRSIAPELGLDGQAREGA